MTLIRVYLLILLIQQSDLVAQILCHSLLETFVEYAHPAQIHHYEAAFPVFSVIHILDFSQVTFASTPLFAQPNSHVQQILTVDPALLFPTVLQVRLNDYLLHLADHVVDQQYRATVVVPLPTLYWPLPQLHIV